MKTLYFNRRPVDHETERRLSATYVPLDELLRRSDVISIHTPLTDKTYHMMNPEAFGRMKEGSYLINTSRGEVVDEKALVHALKTKKIRGAGLDVYEFEPEITRELLGREKAVLLPHIGSWTKETRSRMAEMAARNVIAALEGEKPGNLVPELEVAYHPFER